MIKTHSFHIPVMGIGFTIDTPLKVSQYGIDSVVSLVDDILMEKMRKMYCSKFEIPYVEITETIDDFRAKRITSYLNLLNDLAKKKFEEIRNVTGNEFGKYFNMLPEGATIKQKFRSLPIESFDFDDTLNWIRDNLYMGSIDVNIMTKVDKDNYRGDEKLPVEYNDAHAALRGYANSDLCSSLILSAGMNPRLYSYLEQFEDFFPDADGQIKKKVVLKVSDYRSALIQGKFLAKKGIWVSEYRIESGLNCGGHAFATDGYLMGPILAEFRDKRGELIQSIWDVLVPALAARSKPVPQHTLPLRFTAQGGVGTAAEHQFLIDHYRMDSIGWGTPFLLVPEVTNVDDHTLNTLIDAKEEDLYLSDISPLGVPFNNIRGNTKDLEKLALLAKGRPGSSCPKKYVALNTELSEKGLCTASRQYQHLKIKQLVDQQLPDAQYKHAHDKIVEKSCICVGLGTSALLINGLDTKTEGPGVSVCPGPNIAYFTKVMALSEMVDHIYGNKDVITRTDRPHMFIKELGLYMDYLNARIGELETEFSIKQQKYLLSFIHNLGEGVDYYIDLFAGTAGLSGDNRSIPIQQLEDSKHALHSLRSRVESPAMAGNMNNNEVCSVA